MYYSTRPRWNIPDPNTFPPALHNARYKGWPNPPIQLPHVAAPSFKKPAERHVTFDLNTPSNRRPVDGNAIHTQPYSVHLQYDTHPRANSGAQGIMWPVEHQHHDVSNSCTWNGGAHQNPSLPGVFETRTAAINHDPARRTKNSISLIDEDTQIAYLLAAPCAQLVYDLRYPPNSLSFPPSSSYAGWGYEFLRVPLTVARHNRIRLISQDFPWAFNIGPEPSAIEQGVTCLDVLNALHAALQRPLSDTEWGAAAQDKRASLVRARDRRLNMKPALWLRSVLNADAQPARQEPLILRVDWLGSRVAFGGLVKDEAFARRRLIPGAGEPPFMCRFLRFRDMKLVLYVTGAIAPHMARFPINETRTLLLQHPILTRVQLWRSLITLSFTARTSTEEEHPAYIHDDGRGITALSQVQATLE